MANFTYEGSQLMSNIVTEASEAEDSGESFSPFEHHGIYDRIHRYSYLPDPYPILPNFGVLYLSVPRAAALIANYLATTHPNSEREDKAELRSELTAQVQARMLQEVTSGRLTFVTTIADAGNVTAQRDEQTPAANIYIFYGDLMKWLALIGFDKRLLFESKVFDDYEDLEIALAKQIERLILERRELEGYSDSELRPLKRQEYPLCFYDDEGPDLERVLLPIVSENRDLKRRIAEAQSLRQKRLHAKEEASILVVLAALLEERGYEDWNNGLVSKVAKKAEGLHETVTVNTVRTMLGKAIELIKKSS
jgi:hypothetical protein